MSRNDNYFKNDMIIFPNSIEKLFLLSVLGNNSLVCMSVVGQMSQVSKFMYERVNRLKLLVLSDFQNISIITFGLIL